LLAQQDFSDIKFLCVQEGEQLCLFSKGCLAAGEEMLGPGMLPLNEDKNEKCNLGLGCCSIGCKKPAVCVKARGQCLCVQQAASFPFDDEFVPNFVCATYCLSCAPECGCCKPPYSKAWLDKNGGAPAVEITDDCLDAAEGENMER
jgi:hypothetical protein